MSQIGFIHQSMATLAQASVTGLNANIDNINQLRQQLSESMPPPVAEAPAPVAPKSVDAASAGRVDITV